MYDRASRAVGVKCGNYAHTLLSYLAPSAAE